MTTTKTASAHPLTLASQQVVNALSRLEAAVEATLLHRDVNVQSRESLQNELSQGWQSHVSGLESDIASLEEEKDALKERNTVLTNKLNALQQQYLALQQTTSKIASKLDQSISQLDLMLETA